MLKGLADKSQDVAVVRANRRCPLISNPVSCYDLKYCFYEVKDHVMSLPVVQWLSYLMILNWKKSAVRNYKLGVKDWYWIGCAITSV